MATSTSRSPGSGSPGASESGTVSSQNDSDRYVWSAGMRSMVARPGGKVVHRSGILDRMPTNTPASGALPSAREPFGTYKICLVCLGNICRSPTAEVVLREVLARSGLAGAVSVESAGTGDWHLGEPMFGPARAELARRGYDGSRHRARQIQPSWLPRYDLVAGMDRANVAAALVRPGPGAG